MNALLQVGEVRDRKLVYRAQDGTSLEWHLVPDEENDPPDPRGIWKPRQMAADGVTILMEPKWAPLPGSQHLFLTCPVFEALMHGNRGAAKSQALLMDYARGVGRGWGEKWRGILFRQNLGDLDDTVLKIERFFKPLYGDRFRFLYSKADYRAVWDTGEALLLRHLRDETDYRCLDEGDVLTPDRGWVPIESMRVGDAVYEVAPDGKLVASRVEQKTEQRFSGEMLRHRGRGAYMSFTPEHRIGVRGLAGRIVPVKYEDLGREATVARQVGHPGGTRIESFRVPGSDMAIPGDAYVEFMGWFLSEGHACAAGTSGGRKHQCAISQKKPEGRAEVGRVLRACGIHFHAGKAQFLFKHKALWKYLVQFGHCRDKFVPREILDATEDQQRLFFRAAMMGDGRWQDDRAYYYTLSQRLVDGMAEIAVKLGYSTYVTSCQRANRIGSSWTLAARTTREIRLLTGREVSPHAWTNTKTNVAKEVFNGNVYCIGVPLYHTFVVKQRGCVWVSGNSYHGHEYPWIGFEELTQWPDLKAYMLMQSCCRMAGLPASECRVRSTTNPGGPGHAAVKKRFRLPEGDGKIILVPGEMPRVGIKAELRENFILLHAQPQYETVIAQAATSPMQKRAWLTGDWDITAGGMVDDVWRSDVHVIPSFPADMIPERWIVSRSYDHGQAKPHACGWWLESNGEPIIIGNRLVGSVRGDRILWAEWYGTSGGSNEGVRMAATSIAQGIIDREKELGIHGRVRFGVADNEIYSKDSRGTARSPADDMADRGVFWDPADKSSGSRHRGWERMRTMLAGAIPNRDGTREVPGLFVTDRCRNWLALVPSMPRDQKDPDDVPATYEDHLADMTRYALTWDMPAMSRTTF